MPKPLMCDPALLQLDLRGKTYVVTGANSGIGLITAGQLAKQGARVVLALSRGSREVIVEVHDDGPGIPQTDTRVLDVFYSTKPEGTGLGLPLAHRIASDHGGQLTYESRPGSTTFRVTLPTTA